MPFNLVDGEFSVWRFTETVHIPIVRWVSAEEAVRTAKAEIIQAELTGAVEILIVDGGDMTNFHWRKGEGIVFPPVGSNGHP